MAAAERLRPVEAIGQVERKITERTEAGDRQVDAYEEEPQYLVRSEKSAVPPSTGRTRSNGHKARAA